MSVFINNFPAVKGKGGMKNFRPYSTNVIGFAKSVFIFFDNPFDGTSLFIVIPAFIPVLRGNNRGRILGIVSV
ncbi:MAG TPA: hypothetical protein VEX64_04505 [Pyrinomonadaceae bacterium]|nr:hypothetical protein [Pyrinomonadaceae bacterium]